ncbi:NAD(P)-dependent dehydrogenase, short-chain alcohol dehydrogenase family [Sphingomonas laterariae]|uniref:NAD(P)-dependent dehydrogenase, short-chain alcohol dehydrogenase family n=1 Tax=Edaphosphingomonas laterariae TaxID=861865 RepID=A0A239EE01_9SPHN|nr:SDR family NAD(P)-dependent oxidoreductase [Sphingomonas laterariae]SNS42876.1 NAD(P)-dependent dehydrogenase, short-chain alcohol dehydrogenase family [Sphingomonas laterariae]
MAQGRLQGRTALITGGGEGIGRGMARRMAAEGAAVVIADFQAELGERTAQALRDDFGVDSLAVATDVRDRGQLLGAIDAATARFGAVDILVNNAWGGSTVARLEDKSEEIMAGGLQMALWPTFWAMQAVFPSMKERRWGRIINMCSLNGVNAHLYSAEYNVAKEAVRALTRTAAREWAKHGITANVICPGAASAAYERYAAMSPENAAKTAAAVPMGWVGDPERDIGPVAVFLASEDSRYMTGNTLFVDGGGHINGVPWEPQLPE